MNEINFVIKQTEDRCTGFQGKINNFVPSFKKSLHNWFDIEFLEVSVRLSTAHKHHRSSRNVNHGKCCSYLKKETIVKKQYCSRTCHVNRKTHTFLKKFEFMYLIINGVKLCEQDPINQSWVGWCCKVG